MILVSAAFQADYRDVGDSMEYFLSIDEIIIIIEVFIL